MKSAKKHWATLFGIASLYVIAQALRLIFRVLETGNSGKAVVLLGRDMGTILNNISVIFADMWMPIIFVALTLYVIANGLDLKFYVITVAGMLSLSAVGIYIFGLVYRSIQFIDGNYRQTLIKLVFFVILGVAICWLLPKVKGRIFRRIESMGLVVVASAIALMVHFSAFFLPSLQILKVFEANIITTGLIMIIAALLLRKNITFLWFIIGVVLIMLTAIVPPQHISKLYLVVFFAAPTFILSLLFYAKAKAWGVMTAVGFVMLCAYLIGPLLAIWAYQFTIFLPAKGYCVLPIVLYVLLVFIGELKVKSKLKPI